MAAILAMEACTRSGSQLFKIWKLFPSISGRVAARYVSNAENEVQAGVEVATPTLDEIRMQHKQVKPLPGKPFIPLDYRFVYPEFLPDKGPEMRHRTAELMERTDMLKRRKVIEIPEFYVGSVLAVTASDRFAPGKINRFVGICIQRIGYGLRARFVLRNVVNHQGLEISYDMYNPTIRKIEVLKLEKRLDTELYYLRDALPEYSTFAFDMEPVLHPEGTPVPVNPIKVKLKPRPWYAKWERLDLKGVQDLGLPERYYERARKFAEPWQKYDLMKEYRRVIPEEEQQEIYQDVYAQEQKMSTVYKKAKRKQIRTTRSTTPTSTK